MNAKEYLSQAYLLEQQVRSKMEQIESLKSLAEYISTDFRQEPVKHTRNTSSMEDTVLKIMEMNRELDAQIDALVDKKIEIMRVLEQVERVDFRLILEMRYVTFRTWEEIADELKFCDRTIYRMHLSALEEVQRILDNENSQ